MIQVFKTALLPYPVHDVYQTVLEVESYPLFLPWCSETLVHKQTEVLQEATITLRKGLFKESFRTLNHLLPDQRIQMDLVAGPFQFLSGVWEFIALNDSATEVRLSIDFEMKRGPFKVMLESAFHQIAQSLLEAFCKRVREQSKQP